MRLPVATAAVLLALPVGAQDRAELDQRVQRALDRARPALERHLEQTQGSLHALVCLAAAHDGMTMDDRTFAAAIERLARADITDTYGLSLRLMVAAHVTDMPRRDELVRSDTRRLLRHQSREGHFGYSPNPPRGDLSNTQYAALGLRASVYLNEDVPERMWKRLAAATMSNQSSTGAFGYSGPTGESVSMTAAGIAVMEICCRQLGIDDEDGGKCRRSLDRAWRWMEAHRERLFDLGHWQALYAFYGIERAAVLSGVETIEDMDWFATGAKVVIGLQRRGGEFVNVRQRSDSEGRSQTSPVDTSFAVLFLRRNFQRELGPRGPTTPGPSRGCRHLAADADAMQARYAEEYDVARGKTAVPDLLATMRMRHEAARRAAARALARITGEDFGYHPARDAEANRDALRRAERWWLENRPE